MDLFSRKNNTGAINPVVLIFFVFVGPVFYRLIGNENHENENNSILLTYPFEVYTWTDLTINIAVPILPLTSQSCRVGSACQAPWILYRLNVEVRLDSKRVNHSTDLETSISLP